MKVFATITVILSQFDNLVDGIMVNAYEIGLADFDGVKMIPRCQYRVVAINAHRAIVELAKL